MSKKKSMMGQIFLTFSEYLNFRNTLEKANMVFKFKRKFICENKFETAG